jgi:hypothetical protein
VGQIELSSEPRVADPLLEPAHQPLVRRHSSARAPIGNSIKTLLLLGALAVVGVAFWWFLRPDNVASRVGAREWIIVEVDGEPAVNSTGLASTFVLDGNGEARGADGCNTAVGTWSVGSSDTLDLDWQRSSLAACADFPTTYRPVSGEIDVGDATMTITHDLGSVEAISPDDMEVAPAEDLAGRWRGGDSVIEIGQRGLLRIDSCSGQWSAVDGGIVAQFERTELTRADCELDPVWSDGAVLLPVRHGDALYLRRALPTFPIDRKVIRLDAVDDTTSPLLDG